MVVRYQVLYTTLGRKSFLMSSSRTNGIVIDDLYANELISAEDKEIANRELAQFWKSPPGSGFSPKAVVQGTFTE